MKPVSAATTAAWKSGDYTGTKRPMHRVTIQKLDIALTSYTVPAAHILSETATDHSGKFSSAYFAQLHRPLELPNLKAVSWSRSVEEPVATATFEFYNTVPLPLGQLPAKPYEFDQPGYYTFNRGDTKFSTRFGYTRNGWQDLLVPDRVIRSWEGYGYDPTVGPENDPHMNPSGVWMIDEVTYTSSGMITVTARDLGRILMDQICFPPVVPWSEYPIYWDAYHQVKNPPKVVTVGTDQWTRPKYARDSNEYWNGGAPEAGHHGRDAFDSSTSTYWLSIGNSRPREPYAYEYIEAYVKNNVSAVRVNAYAGPYSVYVSVMENGKWQGKQTIPYDKTIYGRNKANIPFVASGTVGANGTVEVALPKKYAKSERVRWTFGNLWNSGFGPKSIRGVRKYRAAVRSADVFYSSKVTTKRDGGTRTEGNYDDFTDIVKWYLAWSGFYWPAGGARTRAYLTNTDGSRTTLAPTSNDPVLGKGRVWGDLEKTGRRNSTGYVNGKNTNEGEHSEKLGVDVWDKQPILDCITYIRDIVGFNFYIDEQGGAVFRSPNIWGVGNYVSAPTGGPRASRTTTLVDIDEKQTLVQLTSALSSRNVRERVFVGNVPGNVAAVSAGYNPYPSGMRRVGGWTDARFGDEENCQRTADLITLRQMFTYRQNQLTIAANPAIQCDDQVRIYEAVTNEGYIHYVKSIDCSWDLESGEWLYQLTTHWLGEQPFSRWAFDPYDPDQLSIETLAYLRAVGLVA